MDYKATFAPQLLDGIISITATAADSTSYKFVPYYAWDNRAPGKMKVWIDYVE